MQLGAFWQPQTGFSKSSGGSCTNQTPEDFAYADAEAAYGNFEDDLASGATPYMGLGEAFFLGGPGVDPAFNHLTTLQNQEAEAETWGNSEGKVDFEETQMSM